MIYFNFLPFIMTNSILPWILRDKIMNDKLMYISNDDKQNESFCKLILLAEKIEHF